MDTLDTKKLFITFKVIPPQVFCAWLIYIFIASDKLYFVFMGIQFPENQKKVRFYVC